MKRLFRPATGLLALLLSAAGCQRPEEPTPPADLLPPEKVVRILADLHLLEARVENSRLSADSGRALYLAQHKDVLWRHEVSDSAFQRSYRYYGIHGKDLEGIYTAVVDTLTQREKRYAPATPPAPTPPPTPPAATPGATKPATPPAGPTATPPSR